MVLAVFTLALVSTRYSGIKTLTILLIAVGLFAATSHFVYASLLFNPIRITHPLVNMILKAVRILRLHHGNCLFPLLLVPRVVTTVIARALSVAVFLALEAGTVQFQTSTLATSAASYSFSLIRRWTRFGWYWGRWTVLLGLIGCCRAESSSEGRRVWRRCDATSCFALGVKCVIAVAALLGTIARTRWTWNDAIWTRGGYHLTTTGRCVIGRKILSLFLCIMPHKYKGQNGRRFYLKRLQLAWVD